MKLSNAIEAINNYYIEDNFEVIEAARGLLCERITNIFNRGISMKVAQAIKNAVLGCECRELEQYGLVLLKVSCCSIVIKSLDANAETILMDENLLMFLQECDVKFRLLTINELTVEEMKLIISELEAELCDF